MPLNIPGLSLVIGALVAAQAVAAPGGAVPAQAPSIEQIDVNRMQPPGPAIGASSQWGPSHRSHASHSSHRSHASHRSHFSGSPW